MKRPLVTLLLLGVALAASAQDEEKPRKKELDPARLAPEAQLCLKIAKGELIRGHAIEPYLDLLSEGDVEGWNKKRKADGGKVLDLAARTWESKGREDLVLKLEGLDLNGIDLSNVIFMPGTSFRYSSLDEASFRGSCLDGVSFSSVWSFEPRSERQVRSTSLVEADLRDVVWSWCAALERTCRRCGRKDDPVDAQERQGRAQMGRAAVLADFAFCDLEGAKMDADAPLRPSENENDGVRLPSRTLERLVSAVREGKEALIERLAGRHKSARTKECPNPFKAEPLLAAAVAAADSRLVGIAKWKAVALADQLGQGEEATFVGAPDVVLVIDDQRACQTPLLVARGPVFAWRKAALPVTFSASVIVVKDVARPMGVLHGRTVFALADGLHVDPRQYGEQPGGTFHSPVVSEVAGVENLSEADADRRMLQESKLKDYAASLGEVLTGGDVVDPTRDSDGTDPAKALPEDVRKAVENDVGKEAFADMRCYKVPNARQGAYIRFLSNDPKAILIVGPAFLGNASIYSEGPVVLLETKPNTCIQRCVTKSWVGIKGEARVNQLTALGKRVDVEAGASKKDKDPDKDKDD